MLQIPLMEYQDAMRQNICRVCLHSAADPQDPGRCVHENSGKCSLFAHLSEAVEVISDVNSDSIEMYAEALRRRVCANCDHQNTAGICDLRDSRDPLPSWCTLDAYLNLIVGVVEDMQRSSARR